MERFEVERGEPFDHPARWEPAGEAEASGGTAARDAIDAVSEGTGWYRARVAGDTSYPWVYCQVLLGSDGKQIRCPEAVAF